MTTIVIPASSFSAALPQPPFQGDDSFVQRLLQFSITLGGTNSVTGQPNSFAGTDGADTVSFQDARASVRVELAGAPSQGTADISVWGLPQSLMNELSTLGKVFQWVGYNTITISAGNPQGGFTPVFAGTIQYAAADYNNQPDVPMRFVAQSGLAYAVTSVQPSSYAGATNVADIMSGLARAANLGFENNGITAKVSNPYYRGSLLDQVDKLAADAHINWTILPNQVLSIWPIGGSRTNLGSSPPLIEAGSGMIGYPTFAPNGYMQVRMIFNPQVAFGGTIVVQSQIPQANKTWVVQQLNLDLETLVPYGKWEATAVCFPMGFAAPTPTLGTAPS